MPSMRDLDGWTAAFRTLRGHVGGEVFVGDLSPWAFRRADVSRHFDGNEFPYSGEIADRTGPVGGDRKERAEPGAEA